MGYSSFTDPGTNYRLDMDSYELEVINRIKLNDKNIDTSDYKTDQIWYRSKDGTLVPAFVTRKKSVLPSLDTPPEKPLPAMFFGYGGFNIPMSPVFSAVRMLWFNYMNGMTVQTNLRGGGEFGESWHANGVRDKKQNTIDDMIGALEFMHKKGLTSPEKTLIQGAQNGGLVMAACSNQRPDLMSGVALDHPLTDMYRFQKFTIGEYWCVDYGRSENLYDFDFQQKISPYHNIKKQRYPATLVMAKHNEQLIVPMHAYKYLAELQYTAGDVDGQPPLLGKIDMSPPTESPGADQLISNMADLYTFAANVTGAEWKD